MNPRLNQDTMQVTTTFLGKDQTTSYINFYARGFVIECLHYNGNRKDVINEKEWIEAYLMCDGFGEIDMDMAEVICWDWSHVRDSSWDALYKVANLLAKKKWHLKSIDRIVASMLEDCKRGNFNPLKVVPGATKSNWYKDLD